MIRTHVTLLDRHLKSRTCWAWAACDLAYLVQYSTVTRLCLAPSILKPSQLFSTFYNYFHNYVPLYIKESLELKMVDSLPSIKFSHGWMEQTHRVRLLQKYNPAIFEAFSVANSKLFHTNTINKLRYLCCWFGFGIYTIFWPFYTNIVLTTCLIDRTVSSNLPRELWWVGRTVIKIVVIQSLTPLPLPIAHFQYSGWADMHKTIEDLEQALGKEWKFLMIFFYFPENFAFSCFVYGPLRISKLEIDCKMTVFLGKLKLWRDWKIGKKDGRIWDFE